MNNNIEVIGIDHGWSQMKTSNYCFNTSIKELPNVPAFTDNVLQYDNRNFAIGDDRLEVLNSKVENENFYLLTLVAIAKEMKCRGVKEADIALAVGLPLTRFSAERKTFIEYLSKNEFVAFTFENDLYRAHIMNVSVFPQCYAAIAGMLPSFGKKALVVDIGSSDAQLRFVTNSQSGMGLLKCGNVVIPFDNQIRKDTSLYKLYNTNLHEKISEMKEKEKHVSVV